MIEVTCAACGKSVRVADEHAGKYIRCRGCAKPVKVPDAGVFLPIDTREPTEPAPAPPEPAAPAPAPTAGRASRAVVDALWRRADTRTPDERRWDELLVLLRGISWRLTWVLLCLVVLTIHSCGTTPLPTTAPRRY